MFQRGRIKFILTTFFGQNTVYFFTENVRYMAESVRFLPKSPVNLNKKLFLESLL